MKPERFPDSELDQLLARGRLSGGQYDRIEERVLAGVRPERRQRWWFVLAPAAAAASLLGVWLLGKGVPGSDGFTPKGGGNTALAVIDVGCEGPEPHVCKLGQTLMFSVGASKRPGYVAAYAERVGAPAAERIWYFPLQSGREPRIEPAVETRVLREGVRLGPPHVAGRYKVHVWISETPIERAQAGGEGLAGAAEIPLEIVE